MSNKIQIPKIFDTLIPLIITGMAIVVFIGLLFMFSYVLIWGVIVGALLWLASIIKTYLFPNTKKPIKTAKSKGRIIEHNEKKQ